MKPRTLISALVLLLVLSICPYAVSAQQPPRAEARKEAADLLKLPGTAAVTQPSFVFSQGAAAPEATSETNDSAPLISYKIQGADDSEYRPEAPTAVGVYTVRALFPETDTHLEAQATCDFTIRAYVTAVTLGDLGKLPSRPYNGRTEPVPVAAASLPLHFTVEGTSQMPRMDHDFLISSLKLTSPQVDQDPGSMNAVLELQFEDGLYALAPEVDLKFFFHVDILKAGLTVTAKDQAAREDYLTGPEQVLLSGLADTDRLEAVTLRLSEDGTLIVPSDADLFRGEIPVTDQYEITYVPGSLVRSASLKKAPAGAENLVYSGEMQALLSFPGSAETGFLSYQVSYQSSQTAEPELLRTWNQEPPTARVPGIYTVFYRPEHPLLNPGEEASLQVILAPKPLSITAAAEKSYDGTRQVLPKHIRFSMEASQLIPGEEVSIKSIDSSAFPQADVGTGLKMEPGNVVLGGKDAGNYTVIVESYQGTIHPCKVAVTAQPVLKRYGQQDPAFPFTAADLPDQEILAGSLSRISGESPGTYALTKGSVDSLHNPNYEIDFKAGQLVIAPAVMTLNLKPSRTHIRPGKVFDITVTARNAEPDLLEEGWNQPRNLKLLLDGREIPVTYEGDGIWKARAQAPKVSEGSLLLQAVVEDPAYKSQNAQVSLTLSRFGSNPDTGDRILFYGSLFLLSGGILALYVVCHRKKN